MKAGYDVIPTATAVTDSLYADKPKQGYDTIDDIKVEWTQGEVQQPAYRDAGFGIAFWAQLSAMMTLGILFMTGVIGIEPLDDLSSGNNNMKTVTRRLVSSSRILHHSYDVYASTEAPVVEPAGAEIDAYAWPILWATLVSLVVAPSLTLVAFSMMHKHPAPLIRASFYFAIGVNVFLAILCLATGIGLASIGPIFAALITGWYAKVIWHRIPYAAVNLKTAISAIRSQLGVAFLGLAAIPLYIVWWTWWFFVFAMTVNTPFMRAQVQPVDEYSSAHGSDDVYSVGGEDEYSYTAVWWTIVVLFLLSFYWTNQVFRNTIQATVAGSIGTWWFAPEDAVGFCSSALSSSLFRSLTYSFGSICFGSLIVAIIQTLQTLVKNAAENRNGRDGGGGLLLCLTQCLLNLLERLAEYFNKWAFIYVGLYGYSYIEAGKNVLSLFQHRGWTAIISDNLTSRALGMMSFAIGLCTAGVAAMMAAILSPSENAGVAALASFFLALIVGMILSSIIFRVVNNAVDTVIVLFAEAPKEFQDVHPDLSVELNDAWNNAWSDVFTPSAPSVIV